MTFHSFSNKKGATTINDFIADDDKQFFRKYPKIRYEDDNYLILSSSQQTSSNESMEEEDDDDEEDQVSYP